MQTTGSIPWLARPAAKVTACCSAMPTSKNRSGCVCAKNCRPVPYFIAAVMAQMVLSAAPSSFSRLPNTVENDSFGAISGSGMLSMRSNFETPWKLPGLLSAGA